jgi:hypothetical protein
VRDSTPLSVEKILITKLVTKNKSRNSLNENEMPACLAYYSTNIRVEWCVLRFLLFESTY